MLIDSHAHLDYEYDFSTEELINNAKTAGVDRIIAIAAAVDSLERVQALSARFPNIFFTSGIHPHDSKDFTPQIFAKIKNLALDPRCVAIGELGLDFYYESSSRELQFAAIEQQMHFSAEIGKPIVVHTRDADEDTARFLEMHSKEFLAKFPTRIPGVIHCFTGTKELAKTALALGYYISFSGIITFKNAEDLRHVVRDIVPIEKLLVETDSPFLAPIPFRGKKNQPAHTRVVAEKIAELKGLSLEEVANFTRKNTERLFSLPEQSQSTQQ